MEGSLADVAHFGFALEGYKISDEKTNAGDGAIKYYLYLNRFGEFYIMERNTTNGTYRYYSGTKGTAATAWAAREGLSYETFDACFS